VEIEFSYSPKNDRHARRGKMPRCYVALADSLVEAEIGEFPHRGTVRGDDAAVDAACDRWNRAYIRIARRFASARLAEEFGIADVKMRWDEHAGCAMCRCSPGFVINDQRVADALRRDDRWTDRAREAGVVPWIPVEHDMWVTVGFEARTEAVAA